MPMWYRDDTLRLAMVNTAYVRAVDAPNAHEVISRQVELVDGAGMGGPLASAAIARDTGEPQSGAMPATIRAVRERSLPSGPVSCCHISITSVAMPARGVCSPGPERTVIDLSLAYAVMSTFWAERAVP